MKITQCRNATQIIQYAGKKFLIDPVFAEKGTYPPFRSLERTMERNPLHESPFPISEMIDVDAVIITHMHIDHFDEEAKAFLPKQLPVFVQNEADRESLVSENFKNVEILTENTIFHSICLSKTKGRHGADDETAEKFGEVCGVVMRSEQEKTLYLAGDTVWCKEVSETITQYQPSVIILNAGGNAYMGTPLIMGKEDVYNTHVAAPNAHIIATHMEGYNHWGLSRKELLEYAQHQGFSESLSVPNDGESIELS